MLVFIRLETILKEDSNLSHIKLILFVFSFVLLSTVPGFSGGSFNVPTTDQTDHVLIGFFDLRDRETFIQITNVDPVPTGNNIHIQIFNVANDCNENNFFDFYTPFDTHIYNLRDIITNDGDPSGVVLPDDAYGVFTAHSPTSDPEIIGNLRVLDDNGYEYRTNLQGEDHQQDNPNCDAADNFATFNFNTKGGVTLSDIIVIPFDDNPGGPQEITIADVTDIWVNLGVDIFDLDENPFSCRNVVYACVDEDNPLIEAILEEVPKREAEGRDGSANVVSFEYGINNAIPHSKGGELLCPGNNISEGFVRFDHIVDGSGVEDDGIAYIGLNNGNGRGSMDAFWLQNVFNDQGFGTCDQPDDP